MPGIDRIPVPNSNSLVDDALLERIWDDLRKQFHVSRDLDFQFITWIDEPVAGRFVIRGGVTIPDDAKAVFMVFSPNPNPKQGPVRTFAMTPLYDYHRALKEYGHYNGRPHPAISIFGHLVRQHLKALGALTGLTEVDEAAYQKSLKQAHWVLEQAQGSKYEPGVTAPELPWEPAK